MNNNIKILIEKYPDRKDQILNLEADRLEGLIYNCCECEVERKFINDELEPCPYKECKHKTEYNSVLTLIKDKTKAL